MAFPSPFRGRGVKTPPFLLRKAQDEGPEIRRAAPRASTGPSPQPARSWGRGRSRFSRAGTRLWNSRHMDVPAAENAQAFDAASVAQLCCARLHPSGGGTPRLGLQRGCLAQR